MEPSSLPQHPLYDSHKGLFVSNKRLEKMVTEFIFVTHSVEVYYWSLVWSEMVLIFSPVMTIIQDYLSCRSSVGLFVHSFADEM